MDVYTPIHVALNCIVIGPIHNGVSEHPAIVTRVYGEDAYSGAIRINATMFPDGGGEPQYQPSVMLYPSRQEAIHNLGRFRTAYVPGKPVQLADVVTTPLPPIVPPPQKPSTLHLPQGKRK